MAGLYNYSRPGYQTGGISLGSRAAVRGAYGRYRTEFEDLLGEESATGLGIQERRGAITQGLGYGGEILGTLAAAKWVKGGLKVAEGAKTLLAGMTPWGVAASIALPMISRYLLSEGYRRYGGGRKGASAIKTEGGGKTGKLWRGEARDVRKAFGAQEKTLQAKIGSETMLTGGRALSTLLGKEATSELGKLLKPEAVEGTASLVSAEGAEPEKQSFLQKLFGKEPVAPEGGYKFDVPTDPDLSAMEERSRTIAGLEPRTQPEDIYSDPDLIEQLGDPKTRQLPPWLQGEDPGFADFPSGEELAGRARAAGPIIPESEIQQMMGTSTAPAAVTQYGRTEEQNLLIKEGLGGNIPDLNKYLMDQGVRREDLTAHKAQLYEQFAGPSGAPGDISPGISRMEQFEADVGGADLDIIPGVASERMVEPPGQRRWQQLDPGHQLPVSRFTGERTAFGQMTPPQWTMGQVQERTPGGLYRGLTSMQPTQYTPSQPPQKRGGFLDFLRGYSPEAGARQRVFGGGWSPYGVR